MDAVHPPQRHDDDRPHPGRPESVQLVSIPRDTWVPIEGYPYADGFGKINAAFAFGGPAWRSRPSRSSPASPSTTSRSSTGSASRTSPPPSAASASTSPRRSTTTRSASRGRRAGRPSRARGARVRPHPARPRANGDFDRIARQQNFMRATMGKLLSQHPQPGHDDQGRSTSSPSTSPSTRRGTTTRSATWRCRCGASTRTDVQFLTAPFGQVRHESGRSEHRAPGSRSRASGCSTTSTRTTCRLPRAYPDAMLDRDKNVS